MTKGAPYKLIGLLAAAVIAAVGVSGAASGAVPRTTGVVVIDTNLSYANASAAGTGMVISGSGEVLTNNHVIRGATSIRVVDPRTGHRYSASVAGYAIGADVAVLRLAKASGLATVSLGSSSRLHRGQAVTAVGNAGGTGRLVSSTGTITALGRAITVREDSGGTARLSGLIQTDADLQPGDSGGPLLDAAGHVIGMDAAASSGFAFQSGGNEGYAIPIDKALALARQIQAGRSSAAVHVGPTAFLGVLAEPSQYADVPGALVAQVVAGGPVERAGIGPGDVITGIDGRAVSSSATIVKVLQAKRPGDTVRLTWIDQVGNRTTATVKLVSGPPQ
jgi:S1-C subfamily serine protease